MQKTILLISIFFLVLTLGACSSQDSGNGEESPGIPKSKFTSDEMITSFFKQLLVGNYSHSPRQTYSEFIATNEIEATKKEIWKCWKDANLEALKNSGMAYSVVETNPINWTLPDQEVMPIKFLYKGNQPANGYPLIINLHGGGRYAVPGPKDATMNSTSWATTIASSRAYKDSPALYAIPRMADDRIGSWHLKPQRHAMKRICQLAWLQGNVDPSKTYIMGVSQGGYGVIHLAAFMPDYFSAAEIAAAAENPGSYMENYMNIPIRMDVGRWDSDFSRNAYANLWKERMEELAKRTNDKAYKHQINIQAEKYHKVDINGATQWIKGFERNSKPNHFVYVYRYDGDGFPDGVYYIRFENIHLDKQSKIRFEIKREGNAYYITTKVDGTIPKDSYITLYVDDTDLLSHVTVHLNGKMVRKKKITPNRGALVESIALYGDPQRLFIDKVDIAIN